MKQPIPLDLIAENLDLSMKPCGTFLNELSLTAKEFFRILEEYKEAKIQISDATILNTILTLSDIELFGFGDEYFDYIDDLDAEYRGRPFYIFGVVLKRREEYKEDDDKINIYYVVTNNEQIVQINYHYWRRK